MMKILKVVDYTRPYKGKDDKMRPSVNFYIVTTMGDREMRLAIRPSFSRDYQLFDAIAQTEIRKPACDNPTEDDVI